MNKSPSNSKDAFAKATSPQEPKPTKQAETEQIKFVSDPMSFTIHGTHGRQVQGCDRRSGRYSRSRVHP